jgi:methyl-accepting chemotaxis protein
MRSSISSLMMKIGGMIATLILIASACSFYVLSELKIGSPSYLRIVAGKDLVADLLPPPLFLVEAYLAVEIATVNHSSAGTLKDQLGPLRKSYEERIAYWRESIELPENIKALVKGRLEPDSKAFWQTAYNLYLPALEKAEPAALAAASAKLDQAFRKHLQSVNEQVAAANAFARETEEHAAVRVRWLTAISLGIFLFTLALVTAVLLFARQRLVMPVVELSAFMLQVAKGETSDEPPYRDRTDEVGQMSQSISYFKSVTDAVRRAEADAEMQKAKVADQLKDREQGAKWYMENRDFFFKEYTGAMTSLSNGDLVVHLGKPFIKDYEELRSTFNAAIARLNAAMGGVVETADTISASTQEISQAIEDLSRRNETQAATLTETASSVDQFTLKVKETAEGAVVARHAVQGVRADAESGEKIVGEVIAAMDGISQSSEKITQITDIIDEIAFQTNLLALNAGVEAARAGEAGRGFAVVATEVRSLAQRSTEAAKEIKSLIFEANEKVAAGNARAGNSGEALRRIVEQVQNTLSIVDGIASNAESQSNVLREINSAVQEIDRMTQQNAAMAEEINATSRSLASNSASLKSLTDQFNITRSKSAPARPRPSASTVSVRRNGNALPKMASEVDSWEEF